jgi:pimeloyl-ACP methyl ester carboxylesterase
MTTQPATPARQRRIDVGAIALAVTEFEAAGPPLLLIHGIGSRGVSWWPVIDALAERFRPIVVDLRGHGNSEKPERGYLLPDYAGDLSALIEALELSRVLVMGHSLGALAALTWATEHPAAAAAIVVEDPPLRALPQVVEAFDGWIALASLPVEQAAAYYRQEHPDWTAEDCRRRAESITSTAPGVFAELRAQSIHHLAVGDDRITRLAAIRSPLMVIHGDLEAGSMIVPADLARLAQTVPSAAIVRVPGGPHDLHRERTEAFLAAVVPFLAAANGRELIADS